MKTDPKTHFGAWLKQRRKALDLTQAELADQVGCAEVTVRKIESGTTRPSKQLTERLADALLIPADERRTFVAFARRTAHPQPVDHNLPSQATPFIGRTQELSQISQSLANPACRLLTLIGPGGIGKTRLALEAAAQQIPNFAQGVVFVTLAPVGSPELIAPTIIDALKLPTFSAAEPGEQLVNYLRSQHMLLVIDNCEHLLAGIDLLAHILTHAPRVKILATSRERLNLQEEWALPIDGLTYPNEKSDDPVDAFGAIQLFTERALHVRPDFVLADNLDAVIEICRAVEGMPLGIELAASGLRAVSCRQIAAQINSDPDMLTTPLRDIPERHRSLRAVFDHSWNLLTDSERSVLATLSVFRGGFNLDAATQVADATLPLLAALVDKSLIRLQPSGRYTIHEQLRQYLALKLSDEQTVKRRHFDYFLNLAEQAELLLIGGPTQLSWLERYDNEEHNFRAALAWSLDGAEPELGLRLVAALGPFWRTRYRYREGYQWLTTAISKQANAEAIVRCKLYLHLCHLTRFYPGNLKQSIGFGEQALAWAYTAEHQGAIAYALSDLGYVLALDLETRIRSIEMLEESVKLFRDMQHEDGLISALEALGMALTAAGDYKRAVVAQNEGLALARQLHFRFMEGWLLLGLGWSTALLSDLKQAAAHCDECLCVFRDIGEQKGQAFAVLQRGDLAWLDGNYDQAQTYYFESLGLFKDMNFDGDVARNLDRLVLLASALGCPEQAAKILGAVNAYNQTVGRTNFDSPPPFCPSVAALRDQLDDKAFELAYGEGQRMSIQQATEYAVEELGNKA